MLFLNSYLPNAFAPTKLFYLAMTKEEGKRQKARGKRPKD
jgi:hypothetical protein